MSKYFWPASRLTESDMALLHSVRESSDPKIPITRLIADAVRLQYQTNQVQPIRTEQHRKEIAA